MCALFIMRGKPSNEMIARVVGAKSDVEKLWKTKCIKYAAQMLDKLLS